MSRILENNPEAELDRRTLAQPSRNYLTFFLSDGKWITHQRLDNFKKFRLPTLAPRTVDFVTHCQCEGEQCVRVRRLIQCGFDIRVPELNLNSQVRKRQRLLKEQIQKQNPPKQLSKFFADNIHLDFQPSSDLIDEIFTRNADQTCQFKPSNSGHQFDQFAQQTYQRNSAFVTQTQDFTGNDNALLGEVPFSSQQDCFDGHGIPISQDNAALTNQRQASWKSAFNNQQMFLEMQNRDYLHSIEQVSKTCLVQNCYSEVELKPLQKQVQTLNDFHSPHLPFRFDSCSNATQDNEEAKNGAASVNVQQNSSTLKSTTAKEKQNARFDFDGTKKLFMMSGSVYQTALEQHVAAMYSKVLVDAVISTALQSKDYQHTQKCIQNTVSICYVTSEFMDKLRRQKDRQAKQKMVREMRTKSQNYLVFIRKPPGGFFQLMVASQVFSDDGQLQEVQIQVFGVNEVVGKHNVPEIVIKNQRELASLFFNVQFPLCKFYGTIKHCGLPADMTKVEECKSMSGPLLIELVFVLDALGLEAFTKTVSLITNFGKYCDVDAARFKHSQIILSIGQSFEKRSFKDLHVELFKVLRQTLEARRQEDFIRAYASDKKLYRKHKYAQNKKRNCKAAEKTPLQKSMQPKKN